jgi:phenylacetate-CoA ligase
MIIVRGVNLYPSGVEEIIRSLPEILEYRATVDCRAAMTELSLQIEVAPETPQPELVVSRLQASLQSRFSLRIPVTLAPTGSLPRFEMKSRRWVRLTG